MTMNGAVPAKNQNGVGIAGRGGQSLQPLCRRAGLKRLQVCRGSSQPEDDGGAHGSAVGVLEKYRITLGASNGLASLGGADECVRPYASYFGRHFSMKSTRSFFILL